VTGPVLTVRYQPAASRVTGSPPGVADVTLATPRVGDRDALTRTWRGTWSTAHSRYAVGEYDRALVVGVHRGRMALVQQGLSPVRLTDGRRGYFGRNIHDDRGGLLGCIGLPAPAMLDLLGAVYGWWNASARPADWTHGAMGTPLVTLRVEGP